jgi:hypothetical protein
VPNEENATVAAPLYTTSRLSLAPQVEDFRLHVLDDPSGRRDLREFRCGDDSPRRWVGKQRDGRVALRPQQQGVIEARNVAAQLFRGQAAPQVVIVLELLGTLVGFVGIRHHRYRGPYPIEPVEFYINVLARSETFTSFRPEPGLTSGSILLRAALEQIAVWADGPPAVWGLVWEDNAPSRKLFAAHGFQTYAPEGPSCQTLQVRPAGLAIARGALVPQILHESPPPPS